MGQAIQTGDTPDLWRCIMADLGDDRLSPLSLKQKPGKADAFPGLERWARPEVVIAERDMAIWSVMGRCAQR